LGADKKEEEAQSPSCVPSKPPPPGRLPLRPRRRPDLTPFAGRPPRSHPNPATTEHPRIREGPEARLQAAPANLAGCWPLTPAPPVTPSSRKRSGNLWRGWSCRLRGRPAT
jgi:hypothetical protein